jgi:hypothetical protein
VTFEGTSRLGRIEESAFYKSGLKSIVIPSSIVELGKWCFSGCKLLTSVTFESGHRLERIDESVFSESALKSIEGIDVQTFGASALSPTLSWEMKREQEEKEEDF